MHRTPACASITAMKTHEFWRHRASGQIWAIVLWDGIVAGGAGPLGPDEVDVDYLAGFDYRSDEAARIERTREEFEPLDEETLLRLAASVD
jgi:hypothetical protein